MSQNDEGYYHSTAKEIGPMCDLKVLGIDLAKNVFQLHGVNHQGSVVLKKRLPRSKLSAFVAQLPKCLIGLEACGGAHYWARQFESMGHTVKLMAPQFVKPYVKSNKNDANDAEAIAEAVSRPTMRFIPHKSIEQQDWQSLHRIRQLCVKNRTALANQIRGLLSEYGIILPKGFTYVRKELPLILEDAENQLSIIGRNFLSDLYEQMKHLDSTVEKYTNALHQIAKEDDRCKRIQAINGVGPLTATAIVAAVGNAKDFKNGREMAAWIGIVPKQHSSGNKTVLLGISKRGDKYLRTLLIHGARAVVRFCKQKDDARSQWISSKRERSGENKTAVAVANKNVRIIWALLAKNESLKMAM